jgi:hypothetical protein
LFILFSIKAFTVIFCEKTGEEKRNKRETKAVILLNDIGTN